MRIVFETMSAVMTLTTMCKSQSSNTASRKDQRFQTLLERSCLAYLDVAPIAEIVLSKTQTLSYARSLQVHQAHW